MSVAENFQAELEKARETLHKVDENIKKITGRDPTETRNARFQQQPSQNEGRENQSRNRVPPRFQGRLASTRDDRDDHYRDRDRSRDHSDKHDRRDKYDGPPETKRIVRENSTGRPTPLVAIGNPKGWKNNDDYEEGELPRKGSVHSSIHSSISAPHAAEKKTREEALAQQSKDVKVKDRNRRMFGSLLGTLAKFRQEETSQKEKEEKRAKIEQRLEENARQEMEKVRKERHELFMERKRQQANVRRLEWKMHRLREHDEWAARQQPLLKFIKTSTVPPLYYKPRIWNAKTEELLAQSQRKLKELLEIRRKELEEELVRVEEKANARIERIRERGNQVVPTNEQDQELEELEAEIEMYSLALGEEKEEDMEVNPAEASQGPLAFPKIETSVDEPMDSA